MTGLVITCFEHWNSWTLFQLQGTHLLHFQSRLFSKTFEVWLYWRLMSRMYPCWQAVVYLISIGFIADLLLLSVSLTELSLYESNTSLIFVSFLHMASNMFKKVGQKSANVRKPLILFFLTFGIPSTRYVVLVLFQPGCGTISSLVKQFPISWHSALFTGFFIEPSNR